MCIQGWHGSCSRRVQQRQWRRDASDMGARDVTTRRRRNVHVLWHDGDGVRQYGDGMVAVHGATVTTQGGVQAAADQPERLAHDNNG